MPVNVAREIQRLKETGKLSSGLTGKQIGQIVDLYNQSVDNKKEKKYAKDIEARNDYFYPLIKYAIRHGSEPYKSSSYHFQSVKGGEHGE